MRFNNRTSLFALACVIASVVIASSSAHATTLTPLADPMFSLGYQAQSLSIAGENKGKQTSNISLQNLQREAIVIESIFAEPPVNGEALGIKADDIVANITLTTVASLEKPLIVAGLGKFLISFTWDPIDKSGKNDYDIGAASVRFWLDGNYTPQGGEKVTVASTPIIANFQVLDPTPIPAAMWLFVTALGGLGMIGYRRAQSSKAS